MERIGQSADLTLKVGEQGMLQAFYTDGVSRFNFERSVVSDKVGRYIYTLRPSHNAVELLDVEPAIFVIDVTP